MQEGRRVEAAVSAARTQIERATTIAEVVRAMEVPVRVPYRSLKHMFPGLRSLPAIAERRAEEILREQLTMLGGIEADSERLSRRSQLMACEWRLLSGRFPRLARLAQIENKRLKRQRHGSGGATDN